MRSTKAGHLEFVPMVNRMRPAGLAQTQYVGMTISELFKSMAFMSEDPTCGLLPHIERKQLDSVIALMLIEILFHQHINNTGSEIVGANVLKRVPPIHPEPRKPETGT